jgi:formyl-CoA transferase
VRAAIAALRARGSTGKGQVVDLALIEPLLAILGPQPTVYDQLGQISTRTGNRSTNNAPRNLYRTGDGRWVAVSTSSQHIAERVMTLVGHPEFIDEPWFGSGVRRAEHSDELDAAVADWIGARTSAEVLEAFEQTQAAIAPVYDIADVMADPQYAALDTVTTVADPALGPIRMQNVLFRLSDTPGGIRWTGPGLGQHNAEVLGAIGVGPAERATLREEGII